MTHYLLKRYLLMFRLIIPVVAVKRTARWYAVYNDCGGDGGHASYEAQRKEWGSVACYLGEYFVLCLYLHRGGEAFTVGESPPKNSRSAPVISVSILV